MSGTETNYFIQAVRYRKRAAEAEKALMLYTTEMHLMKDEYEKNMLDKDITIQRLIADNLKLAGDLREVNDKLLEKML